jgi:hypothetical protein
MKDSEFIELLNLYLDHEISPAKAALLEAEVTRDPARRQLYRQYCQMQKACVVLAGRFEGAEAGPRVNLLAASPVRRSRAGLWATGFVAAAACAAFALLPRLHPAGTPAAAAPASAAVAQSAPVEVRPAAPAFNNFQPVFTVHAPMAAPATQLAWIQQVQMSPIAPLSATPLFLAAKPGLDLENRSDAERSPGAGPEEKAAFQFQR